MQCLSRLKTYIKRIANKRLGNFPGELIKHYNLQSFYNVMNRLPFDAYLQRFVQALRIPSSNLQTRSLDEIAARMEKLTRSYIPNFRLNSLPFCILERLLYRWLKDNKPQQ